MTRRRTGAGSDSRESAERGTNTQGVCSLASRAGRRAFSSRVELEALQGAYVFVTERWSRRPSQAPLRARLRELVAVRLRAPATRVSETGRFRSEQGGDLVVRLADQADSVEIVEAFRV